MEILGMDMGTIVHGDIINIEGQTRGTCVPGKVILGSGYHTYKNRVYSYVITGTVPHSPYARMLHLY